MALSNQDLQKWHHRKFVIEPYDTTQETPVGYDLRFGYVIDPISGTEIYPKGTTHEEEISIIIPPKRRIVVLTRERIFLSGSLIGTVHARSGITASGILVNSISIDPHWSGRFLLTMYNSNDEEVHLNSNKGIATLILHSAETHTDSWARKSSTKDLLDHKQYSSKVTDKIFRYLNKYEDSNGEKRYKEGRKKAKYYQEKNSIIQWLIRIKEDTKWYRILTRLIFSTLTLIFLLLVASVLFPEYILEYKIFMELKNNREIISLIITFLSLMMVVYTNLLTSHSSGRLRRR